TLAEIDINVSEVWDQLISGAGIQVGIISGGFDLSHVDLEFEQDLALDAIGAGTLNFQSDTDFTGTAVAGIIGARNNSEGIVGIAYEADLVPIRAVSDDQLNGTADATTNATALRWRLGLIQDSDGDGIVDGGIDGFAD
ncbi:unnamed protein product, partial [Ectocarpus sp. 4 AP-2014]